MSNLRDRNIASLYQYPNALDELHSHVAPEQLNYLLSVLSAADNSKPISTEVDGDDLTYTSTFHDSSWSVNSKSVSSEEPERTKNYEIFWNKNVAYQDKQVEKFTGSLALPLLSKNPQQSGLLQIPSFDSTLSTAKSGGEHSSISLYGLTSKDSLLAVKGVSSALEQSLANNVHLAEMKYSQMRLPMVEFQGTKLEATKLIHQKHGASCDKLPVCKRIVGKYMIGRKSRSSSIESVKAESLPDLDNPLINIAGKIANEPVNPFPTLKKAHFKKSSSSALTPTSKQLGESGCRMASSYYVQKIEQDIDKELDMLQDYKDVSEFFTQSKYARRSSHHHPKGRSGVVDLSRRVTNPLYKVYDPTGYHKSEDELARECMQMICDDFNKWIQTISNNKRKNSAAEGEHGAGVDEVRNENQDCQQQGSKVIDPEFLIQILRKDLELPEN